MKDTKKLFELSKTEAILVVSQKNRQYFTEFSSSYGFLVLTPEQNYFITDPRYYEMAEVLRNDGVTVLSTGSKTAMEMVLDILNQHNVKTVGYEDTELTVSQFNDISSKLTGINLVAVGFFIGVVRRTKDQKEIQYIKTAQSITDKAFSEILKIIKPDITEKEVAVELAYIINKLGGDGLAFDTIVASGVNTSKPHAHPTDKKIAVGDAVTLDFGAAYKGYCSDMTRTVFVGEPDAEMKNIYSIVKKAQQNAIENARCGISGRELDAFAREVIVANGYGEFFTHGTGHSLGIDIHEEPRASALCSENFYANMLVTVEPGIYVPSFGGVRIEDLLLFEETEVINLTTSDKNIIIL